MKFYDVNGLEIDKKQFVKTYGDSYFVGNKREVKGVGQNSRYVEEEIEKILCNGIKNQIDVVHILAWKIGKLKHNECDRENKFVYHKDWTDAEKMKAKRYKNDLELKKFCDYIMDNLKHMEKICDNEPQKVLNELNEGAVKGIGTVYLVTMLYFISKKKYPIYDRFAMKAIYAIANNVKPGTVVNVTELPEKHSKKFGTIMSTGMKDYIDKLKNVFGDDYNNRDVDRALWVYGHMF